MAWRGLNFGSPPTGVTVRQIGAEGREPICEQVTRCLVPGLYQLPSPHGQAITAYVLNRSNGLVSVLPGSRDRLEGAEPDEPLLLMPGYDALLWLVEGNASAPPREWYVSVWRNERGE